MEKNQKLPKQIDCSKCKHQCTSKFSEELRSKICESFWKLSYSRQKDFILANVRMKPPKRRRPSNKETTEIKRTNTKVFHLTEKRVCQAFFLKTLCISNGPLIKAFNNRSEFTNFFEGTDQRGRHEPSNKLKQEIVDSIVTFLNEKCIAETTGKFKKKIICNGSLRNLFEEFKNTNDSCPSYTSFKKIFYDKNFSLPQERQKPIKQENQAQKSKIQVHNVEVLKLEPIENSPETSNMIITQTPEVYEIQFVTSL